MRFSEGSPIRFPAVFSEGSPVVLPAAFSEESPVRLLAEDLAERKKGMNRQEDTRRKTDYRIYRLSLPEVAVCLILYLGIAGIISFLYYNSPLPILIAAPGGVAALRVFRNRCIEKRQRQLYVEFKDMVQSLAASMGAGYAFENAFTAAYEEMRKLYGDSGLIVKELKWVIRGLRMHEDIEYLLQDMGERSGVREISEFAQVVGVAKRTGGNMVHIMKATAADISRKMEVELEIQTMIAAKKYEQKIMLIVPFFILAYLRIANGSYIHILYENIAGRLIMTICLAVSILSAAWSRKMIRIGV